MEQLNKQTIEQLLAVRDAFFDTLQSVEKHEGRGVAFLAESLFDLHHMNDLIMMCLCKSGMPQDIAKSAMRTIASIQSKILTNAANALNLSTEQINSAAKWSDRICDDTQARIDVVKSKVEGGMQ